VRDLVSTLILLGALQGAVLSLVLWRRVANRVANRMMAALVALVTLMLLAGGDVTMPWAKPDFRDYGVRATVGLPLGGRHWKLAGWLSPTLRGTENAGADMTAIGADLRLTGGYYARGWFLAGEAGIDWIAATHIAVSDAYRTRVYAGAKDGWYGLPGGTVSAGLNAGLSFSSFDLVLRAGLPRTTSLAAQTLPAYLTVGVNLAL